MSEAQGPANETALAPAMPMSMARRWLSPLLAIPTPLIFVAAAMLATMVLWRQGSLGQVGAALQAVSPWNIAVILLIYAASILLLGVRWHTLVRLAGGGPGWLQSTDVFLTSVIVNYAAPVGLAVPTRAALTVRDLGLTKLQSGLVVGWELALDVFALLAISAAWLALGGRFVLAQAGMSISGVAVVVALGLLACIGVGVATRLPAVRERLFVVLAPLAKQPAQRPTVALLALLFTGIYWMTQLGVMAALTASLGVSPSTTLVLGLMGPPVLIGMLSPVPGGAGIREALMATTARFAGVATGPVILAAIAYRLALFVVTPAVWGLLRFARAGNRDRPSPTGGSAASD